MTQTVSTDQLTHRDTDEALAVSDMQFASRNKVTSAYARERQLLMGRAPQVAVAAGGTPIGPDATPRQAFAAAGADFTVEPRPVAFATRVMDGPEDDYLFGGPISTHKAMVRSDTGACLGVVGRGYTPIQNEALINLFEFLREDAQIENIVVLKNGRRVYATASVAIEAEVKEGDKVRRYLHAFNSHDGTSAFGVFFSDMRLVCANQLRFIAGRGARTATSEGAGLVIRHTRSAVELAKQLPQLIDLENRRFHHDLDALKPMTTTRLTTETSRAILEATFADKLAQPITDKDSGEKRQRTLADLETEVATIRSHAFNGTGIGIDTSDRSVWNLFQAITQYETWDSGRTMKDDVSRARARLESLWGGTSAQRIERAREACLAVV